MSTLNGFGKLIKTQAFIKQKKYLLPDHGHNADNPTIKKCTCLTNAKRGSYVDPNCKMHQICRNAEIGNEIRGHDMKKVSKLLSLPRKDCLPPFVKGDRVYVHLPQCKERFIGTVLHDEDYATTGEFSIIGDDDIIYEKVPGTGLSHEIGKYGSPRTLHEVVKRTVETIQNVDMSSISLFPKPQQLEYKEVERMIVLYTKLLKLECEQDAKKKAIILCRRSTLYASLELYLEALYDANLAIKIHPKLPNAYFRKGYCLFAMRRYAEAAKEFREGLTYEPGNIHFRHALNVSMEKNRVSN